MHITHMQLIWLRARPLPLPLPGCAVQLGRV
jgi:hypothetical protein